MAIRSSIHDRDPLFIDAFRATLRAAGVKCLKLPARSPNLNAFAERFALSIRSECLDKLVPLGPAFSLASAAIAASSRLSTPTAPFARRDRLGGILSYYYRPAAYLHAELLIEEGTPIEGVAAPAPVETTFVAGEIDVPSPRPTTARDHHDIPAVELTAASALIEPDPDTGSRTPPLERR